MRVVRHFWLPLALSSALLFFSPAPAAADTIRITSGFVELGGAFDIAGAQRGFRMIGSGYGGGAGPNAYVFCDGETCSPGDTALLQHAFGGLDLFVSSATIDGVTHTEINNLSAVVFAEIGFSSTHPLPAGGGTALLHSPFMMQGSFSHPGGLELLTGSGIVTTNWIARTGESGIEWDLASARYDFSDASAVPEPGTMVLVALGAATAAVRRRTRARS